MSTTGRGAADLPAAARATPVATLSAGYADGRPRTLSNKVRLWDGDTPVPLIGRVSMDLITADIGHLPEVPRSLDILGPHQGADHAREGVAIDPVEMPLGAAPAVRVCEGCPSSVLRHHGWPHKGYKGKGERPREVREEILSRAVRAGLVVPESVGEQAIADEEGDLLDALVLALEPAPTVAPKEALIEGWVF